MLRFFFSLLFIAGLLQSAPLFAQSVIAPGTPPHESGRGLTSNQMYDQAKFYLNQLESNNTLAQSRDNWLKGTRNFRKIYLLHPRSENAPACLYMLGGMFLKMYERFKLGIDLDEAISYYKDTYRLFPDHFLADDALYAESQIYFSLKNDPKKASANLERIVSQYANSDMHSKATERLKVLSKDYDLPLPRTLVGSTQSHQLTTIQPVKFWSSPDYVRVVVMADNPVTYTDKLIRKQPNESDNLYIDFKSTYIAPELRRKIAVEEGLLKHLRVEQIHTDSVRVNLDVLSIETYKIFSLPNPFRIIIDIHGKKKAKTPTQQIAKPEFTRSSTSPPDQKGEKASKGSLQAQLPEKSPSLPISIKSSRSKRIVQRPSVPPAEPTDTNTKPTKLSLAQQLGLGVRKIVIDPGHGGKDPGAMSNQMLEKDIVLEIAQKLRPKLQHLLNCEVILTRNDDTYLTLEERTAIANTEEADLFISLHLNAHHSGESKGLETYFLNLSTNAEAMRVAAMENATSTHQISDLEGILSDIMKNSKIDESSRLAQLVHSTMLTGLSGKKFGEIKNLGVKQAPFYVLIGAQMPSILIEIAFISNKEEAENLKNAYYLDSVASEIANGVSAYVKTNTASL
jgi:N-acetylmuramoyl-L-alanine amidase